MGETLSVLRIQKDSNSYLSCDGAGLSALEMELDRAFFGQPVLPTTMLMFSDRLYLGAFTTPPTASTPFPGPKHQSSRRSPSKRSARAADGPSAISSDRERFPPCYFSIDDTLLYNAFHHDFGPLHIGHLYRFAVQFHDILGAAENKRRPVVFWSKADPRSE